MEIIKILQNMEASQLGIVLVSVLTLVQITPVKINPWSSIAKVVGRALNVELRDLINENEANNVRYRILRFDDEIRHRTKHTEEHFNQIIGDIDKYERYCQNHPAYKNNKAELAIRNIKDTYDKCRRENSFLP